MVKKSKIEQAENLRTELSGKSCVIAVKNNGMNVVEFNTLRAALRECDASFKIIKNTIAGFSLKDTEHSNIASSLTGPIGLAFSSEPVSLTKSLVKFAKDCDNAEIICGSMDGAFINLENIESLSKLDSLDDIRAKIIGALSSPAVNITRLISTLPVNLARLINLKYSN